MIKQTNYGEPSCKYWTYMVIEIISFNPNGSANAQCEQRNASDSDSDAIKMENQPSSAREKKRHATSPVTLDPENIILEDNTTMFKAIIAGEINKGYQQSMAYIKGQSAENADKVYPIKRPKSNKINNEDMKQASTPKLSTSEVAHQCKTDRRNDSRGTIRSLIIVRVGIIVQMGQMLVF